MATKPKPKGWNALSKAQQDKWKKDNFSSSTKVTKAQLDMLRAEKTPEKAIAKYKNDPAMREALNRFYGKTRVGSVTSTSTPSSSNRNGPGGKMPDRPRGGPGAKPRPTRVTKPVIVKSSGPSAGKAAGAAVGLTVLGGAAARSITSADKTRKKVGKHAVTKVKESKKVVGKHAKTVGKHAATVAKTPAGKVATKVLGKTPLGRAVTVGAMVLGVGPKGKLKTPGKHKKTTGKSANT